MKNKYFFFLLLCVVGGVHASDAAPQPADPLSKLTHAPISPIAANPIAALTADATQRVMDDATERAKKCLHAVASAAQAGWVVAKKPGIKETLIGATGAVLLLSAVDFSIRRIGRPVTYFMVAIIGGVCGRNPDLLISPLQKLRDASSFIIPYTAETLTMPAAPMEPAQQSHFSEQSPKGAQ